jgi:hypothetical protein
MAIEAKAELLCLTHHSFLVGRWENAPVGSVIVCQADDEESIVLLLKPDDVQPLIDALSKAARPDRVQETPQPENAKRDSSSETPQP